MRLRINGQEMSLEINNGASLLEVLACLKLNPYQTAVEKNGVIIYKVDYSLEQIYDNDKLELIRFMGGGRYYLDNVS